MLDCSLYRRLRFYNRWPRKNMLAMKQSLIVQIGLEQEQIQTEDLKPCKSLF